MLGLKPKSGLARIGAIITPRDDRSYLISQDEDPVLSDAFKYLCRHLVSLQGSYQAIDDRGTPLEEARFFAYAGCVLAVKGLWFFVTAGHALKELQENVKNRKIVITGCNIIDNFGPKPVSSKAVPFPYEGNNPAFFDKHGLDFGLIYLRQHYQTLLEANGVVPIVKANWEKQEGLEFDRFFILGFPEEFHSSFVQNDVVYGGASPTLLFARPLESAPEDLPETEFPRFVARLDDNVKLKSLKGMSGGPIIGLKSGRDDLYWIVAIQSSWLKDRRIVFGCPVPVFADLVEDAVTEIIEAHDEDGEKASQNPHRVS
jgi:hypothetical protein